MRGPKHGGANEYAFLIQNRYANPDEAEADILLRIAQKEIIIGFGHPVYTISDPRNPVIKEIARTLSEEAGDWRLFLIAERLEALAAHGRSAAALPSLGAPLAISAATRTGLDALLALVWQELGVDRPAPEHGALAGSTGPAAGGVAAAGGIPAGGGAAAAAARPAAGAWEPEEPETLLVPLTRPRTPRGAAAPGPDIQEAPETAGFDGDGAEADAPDLAGSAARLDGEPLARDSSIENSLPH